MSRKPLAIATISGFLLAGAALAQESVDSLVERGDELFHTTVGGCATCHGPTGEGLVGPSLHFGPSPANIVDQFVSNPIMIVVTENLNPTNDDLVAISMYIRSLAGLPLDPELPDAWRGELVALQSLQGEEGEFRKTAHDRAVERVERFSSVVETWERRANEGSVWSAYPSRIVARFDPGQPKFQPQPGKTYFYENVGTTSSPSVLFEGYVPPTKNQLVVGDAETHEIIASYAIPETLRSVVHTSAMSSDGRWAYMVGPREPSADGTPNPSGSWTMLKLDALTLQPVVQVTIGARLHHGQVFGDKILFDMFARDPDGLGLILYDPETDEVMGGIRDIDMGGFIYTVWTDHDYEKIYAMMEPAGYAPGRGTGMRAVTQIYHGEYMALRPFWIAVIDPETWEVEAEYPIPGYRPNWAVVDSAKEHIYVINSSSNAAKIRLSDGAVVWTTGTGIGPYGGTLTADESELWIADKGEGAHHLGRTITVIDTHEGHATDSLYGGYKVDHVLLSPNGKEMWATSNGEGRIYIYDAETKEQIKVIDMPENGDAHGLIWVHYDENGQARTVRDQGNFHNGINPILGRPLDY
jgi:mono/diheme cytochrome c family protein